MALEQGVEVRFAAGDFRTGDWWTIPARTLTGAVEWPEEAGAPALRAPEGTVHRHARLGLITVSGGAITAITDCRALFPPLTGLVTLDYVGGDGQTGVPDLTDPAAGAALPAPLQVAVSNGDRPVAGARVRFSVTAGGGTLDGAAGPVEVATGTDGVAAVAWRLGSPAADQRVEARLIADGAARHLPVRFAARFATARATAFDPANCPPLAGARTVQAAIDTLCASMQGPEPGFRIEKIVWTGTDAPYAHDGTVALDTFMGGLSIGCDEEVAPETVESRPVVLVTLYAAPPGGGTPLVQQPYRLAAKLAAQDETIFWQPDSGLADILRDLLEGDIREALCELTVRGDNIRAAEPAEDGSPRWLDAEGLERPGARILPTGERRRGGTLVSWFWLRGNADDAGGLAFAAVARQPDAGLTGRVVRADTGEGISGVPVRLLDVSGDVRDEAATRGEGVFAFADVPRDRLVVEAGSGQDTITTTVPALLDFQPDDFAVASVAEIDALSASMRDRLVAENLAEPAVVAGMAPAELAGRLGIAESTARRVISTVRGRARGGG